MKISLLKWKFNKFFTTKFSQIPILNTQSLPFKRNKNKVVNSWWSESICIYRACKSFLSATLYTDLNKEALLGLKYIFEVVMYIEKKKVNYITSGSSLYPVSIVTRVRKSSRFVFPKFSTPSIIAEGLCIHLLLVKNIVQIEVKILRVRKEDDW